MKVTEISMTATSVKSYVVVTPHKMFSTDPLAQQPALTIEDARAIASKLTGAKVYLEEVVTVYGFSGTLKRVTEVTNQDLPQV